MAQHKRPVSRSGYTDRELMYTVHPQIKAGGLACPRLVAEWEAKEAKGVRAGRTRTGKRRV